MAIQLENARWRNWPRVGFNWTRRWTNWRHRHQRAHLLLNVLVALVAPLLVLAFRLLMAPWIGETEPFLSFVAAVIVAAWFGGLFPGIVATVVSVAICDHFFLRPGQGYGTLGVADSVRILTFLGEGFLVSVFSETLHNSIESLSLSEARLVGAVRSTRKSEERLKSIVDNVVDGIITIDEAGRIESWNEAARRIFGYRDEDVYGKNVAMLMPDPYRGEHDSYLARYIRSGERRIIGIGREVLGRRQDGSVFPMDLSVGEFRFDNRRYFTGVVRDITERKRVAQELEQAKEAAESASRAKSRFLANISHEIRTPLGVIVGFADLALAPNVSPQEIHEYLKTIRRNSEHLNELIGDVLDLAKVEEDSLKIEKVRLSLRNLLEEVRTSLSVKAREKGIDLIIESDGPVPDFIHSDPVRLRQILINVLGNAIKFTPQGYVRLVLRAQLPKDESAPVMLDFTVEDSGIGMTDEQKKRIFRPFAQADESMTRRFGGTGLGLVLSRRLAQALGGDLKLERSEPGRGSVFKLTILDGPLSVANFQRFTRQNMAPGQSLESSPLESPPLHGLKVLLVEDSKDNQVMVSRFLSLAGAAVDFAGNGHEGVHKAIGGFHDVILMDIQMPVMDGIEATRRLRQIGYQKPILALTANALKEERDNSKNLGFNSYLTKPLNRASLVNAIRSVLPVQQEA